MDLMKPNVRRLARPRDGDIVSPRNGQTSGDFWAITSYFNPSHYQRRLVNYRIFRERLQMPLVASNSLMGQTSSCNQKTQRFSFSCVARQ
jgi:hypothetical protein